MRGVNVAVYSVLIALQSSHKDLRNIAYADFVGALEIGPEDQVESTVSDGGMSAASVVVLSITRFRDFSHQPQPWDAMDAQLVSNVKAVANFLDRRPVALFEDFRRRGLNVKLFIDVWMDQDQMGFDFTPELLKACGRVGIGISLISNDF